MPRPALDGQAFLPELNMSYAAGPSGIDLCLDQLLSASMLSVDIETYGLGADGRRLKCVGVATPAGSVVFDPRDEWQARQLSRCLVGRTLIFHNAAYDVPNLFLNGLIDRAQVESVVDTLIYARLAWPDVLIRKGLEDLTQRFFGFRPEESMKVAFKRLGWTIKEGYKRMDIDSPLYLMGNAVDAVMTARIYPMVRKAALETLTQNHPFSTFGVKGDEAQRLLEREQLINRLKLRRSCAGIRVDFEYLDRYRQETSTRRGTAEAELESAGIRPGNANDLMKVIGDALPAGYPRTKKTNRPSTVAAHLEVLQHPLARLFVQAKQIAHVEDDYLAKVVDLAVDDRIHPVVNILAATTGRMSYGEPPLHQFPEDARGILLADEGDALSSIDWSQIEPVVVANIAGDFRALQGYEAGTSDMYQDVGQFAHISRKEAKVTLLAQLYGEGLGKLAADLGIDFESARTIRDLVFRTLPATRRLLYKLRDIGESYRKVFTLSGRIVPVPMGRGFDGGPPSVATHKAVNYFVQGSAYDLLAECLMSVRDAGLADAIYLTMHDEVVCSTSAAHDIRKIMETPPERLVMLAKRVPVLRTDRADLGERWAAA